MTLGFEMIGFVWNRVRCNPIQVSFPINALSHEILGEVVTSTDVVTQHHPQSILFLIPGNISPVAIGHKRSF